MKLLEYLGKKEGCNIPVSSISYAGDARGAFRKSLKNSKKSFDTMIEFFRYFMEGEIVYDSGGYTVYRLKNVRRHPYLIHGDIDMSNTNAMRETLSECEMTNTIEEATFLVKEMIRDEQ